MSQTLNAPASMAPGAIVAFADGTSVTIGADGTIVCPAGAVAALLEAGCTYAGVAGASLASAHVLVGSAGGVATSVALSGDATLASTGALTIATTKLAKANVAYVKTDSGVKDLLAAAAAARTVIINVTVTAVFANGDGAQPTLTIGEEGGSASKFEGAATLTDAAVGSTFSVSGTLTSGKKLQATLVAGTGTTETGAYSIDVIAVG